MYPGEFDALFGQIAHLFALKTIAEKQSVSGNFPRYNPETPIWDVLGSDLVAHEYIEIGSGRVVSTKRFLRKPIRILFFLLLAEFEGRLFRIEELRGKDISELNEGNLNDFVRNLSESEELLRFQTEYPTRAEFHEDMKALSAFRNIIMHVNKKLEREVKLETLVKRKRQAVKVLSALQQILDKMKHDGGF